MCLLFNVIGCNDEGEERVVWVGSKFVRGKKKNEMKMETKIFFFHFMGDHIQLEDNQQISN